MSGYNRTIGVVGGGTMGRGIVQLFAQAGHRVLCYDVAPGAAQKAADVVVGLIRRSADKGQITAAEAQACIERIGVCEALGELGACDVVIEAVVEDLAVKIDLFRVLEDIVAESAILASNTSSLVVSEIAAGCQHPERVAGLHFFNPVPLMKVAEVVPGVRTSAATVRALETLVAQGGHRAVIAADQPGFLVNHAGRGFYTEALRILEEGVAGVPEIDTLLRDAAGFRMGPFELLDLTGLDVSGKVMASIYEQFQHEPRFRPSSLIPPRIAAGLLGRKSGQGWYRYEGERKQEPAPLAVAPLRSGLRVWIDPAAGEHAAICGLARSSNAELRGAADDAELLIVQFWGQDATGYCVEHGLDARRCVAVDPLPGLSSHRTLMLTAVTAPEARDAAAALFVRDGTPLTVINDSPGFVVQRVLATIVNIAANIAQRGIASVPDIEDAVKLGLGYPHGPLAWGDRIGGSRVLTMLTNIQARTGDPRYRPSPWLSRRAGLRISLLTPDAARHP
jgi:3-hydroxybutyryl-CoA dehydrogenase